MSIANRELLPGHPVVSTGDLDQVRAEVSRFYLPHRLELLERGGQLRAGLNAVRLAGLTVGYLRYGAALRMVTADADNYHVNVPLAGAPVSRCGRHDPVVGGVDRAAVFLPGQPAEIRWPANSAQLCLMIGRQRLEVELSRLLGRPLTDPLEFTTGMDLTGRYARAWRATLDTLDEDATPLAALHLETMVVHGLLLAQPHNYLDALTDPRPPALPRTVRRAIELMHDHPDRLWSPASLAAAVAVSARSLQEGFRRSVGIPPMAYLRGLRLDRVHAELIAAEPDGPTVSSVANRWGFAHPGRFAAAYRQRFDCAPSQTLRRG